MTMQTITVELLDGQALPKLQQMERQNLLRLVSSNASEQNPAAHFEALFQQWKKETLFSSSGTEITEHPAYQGIIAMGPPVVPFILIKLREDPQHLFYALFKITGENPVQPKHVGMLTKMKEDWLEWGANKGYLS
jgi:hypothetical protein